MIVYDYDSNAILAEPLKSRNQNELLQAYTKLHALLVAHGLKPFLNILDNEAPGKLKQFMRANQVAFQLVPPHIHCRNAAERIISTFKDHFIATLSPTNPTFSLHLCPWCRLIDQVTITLNLLRPSHLNPKLSAEAQLNGAFDFNKPPLAPPDTKLLIHEKLPIESPGPHTASTVGTLAVLPKTTDAIESKSPKPLPSAPPTPSSSFLIMRPCPKRLQPIPPEMQQQLSLQPL
jgi:hypothetical protein